MASKAKKREREFPPTIYLRHGAKPGLRGRRRPSLVLVGRPEDEAGSALVVRLAEYRLERTLRVSTKTLVEVVTKDGSSG